MKGIMLCGFKVQDCSKYSFADAIDNKEYTRRNKKENSIILQIKVRKRSVCVNTNYND